MEEYLPKYEGNVIRPPSESGSLIFQVTLGCTDNKCIFCPAYKDKSFRIKNTGMIEQEFREASRRFPGTRKIFFADGDALVIEQEKLIEILSLAGSYFPMLTRVSAYGSIKSLENKSVKDLARLRALKLGKIYLGFETGDKEVYSFIRKYGSPAGNVETCLKVKSAGIQNERNHNSRPRRKKTVPETCNKYCKRTEPFKARPDSRFDPYDRA